MLNTNQAKNKISILIVNYNSADFLKISLYALDKLTKNTYEVYIVDNNSNIDDYKKLEQTVKQYTNVHLERLTTNLVGSLAHGTALNYLVKKVNTPYFSILDADATWLCKDWDEILIKQINNNIKSIGTEAPGDKPKDFPLMFAILFESETFNKLDIDFRPKDIQQLQDTGFELKEKYLNTGFSGKNIEMKNTRTYKKGPFKNIICAEYYLDNDYNQIFASHFGRGSSLGADKYTRKFTKYLYSLPFIGKYFLNKKGESEKNNWIKICRKIIDMQA